MKKMIVVRYVILVTSLFFCSVGVFAQHNHGGGGGHNEMHIEVKPPPHGGVVKMSGKYGVELVVNPLFKSNQIMIYLYKGVFKPILNKGIMGEITIKPKNGESSLLTLQPRGPELFVAQLKDVGSFKAVIKFVIKGKTITTIFDYAGKNINKTYTCSMHPEVQSDGPGKCSKCGMNLVPKKDNKNGNDGHNHSH